jgi:hypothetical protein
VSVCGEQVAFTVFLYIFCVGLEKKLTLGHTPAINDDRTKRDINCRQSVIKGRPGKKLKAVSREKREVALRADDDKGTSLFSPIGQKQIRSALN